MSKLTQLLQQAVKALEAGRSAEAVALCEKVVEREPHNVLALNFLALVEHQRGRNEQALSWIQAALKISPSNAEAQRSAGTILLALGRYAEAVETTRKAVAIQPDLPGVHSQLGKALTMLERGDEAIASLEIALRQESHPNADLLNTLAAALEQGCDFVRAEEFARRALLLQPDFKDGFMSLGNSLSAQGRLGEALRAYDQALALKSDDAMTRYNRSLVLLASGDFLRGWEEYEWRWSMPVMPSKRPIVKQPAWDGGEIQGRTILLYSEQGAGDVFHFIRYVLLLAERGARVLLVCPKALHPLLGKVEGLDQVIAHGEAIPPFDTHAALMSLPFLLKTTLENVPAKVPYLPIPAAGTFPLKEGPAANLKVGLVWSGGGSYRRNRIRSTSLEQFLPVLRLPGIRFFSLQCGPASAELNKLPADVQVEDIGSQVRDFADTAAAMGQMDLVISVCTSTLHLAGALGRPVWGVLSYAPCWRWMLGRSDTPWYPNMTLFRQPKPGDWAGAIAQIEVALRDLTQRAKKCSGGEARAESPKRELNHVPQPAVAPRSSPLYYAGQAGGGFGWGVCNRHLLVELSKLVEVRKLDGSDPMFQSTELPGNLFMPLQGSALTPCSMARGRRNLGYLFFEDELTPESVENAQQFDVIFAGSSWCLERLREKGISHAALLIQGVDTTVFHPQTVARDGRFVLFSGGKFELRKGQDLVLRAFAVLCKKYPDMVLLTAWHNPWPASMETMRASPHIRFELSGRSRLEQMEHIYRLNGIEPKRVSTMSSLTPEQMAHAYRQSDLGLFPNRCEGGTNLVLMEYMACGKPAIVSDATGHRDLCNARNAFLLQNLRPLTINDKRGQAVARWVEPSLDEIIASVEYAYEHRGEAQMRGAAAAGDMKQWHWKRAAETIISTIGKITGR
jgi:tetratricopeptide (TPR) repeat protein/glycosyltransferase involved in cell wall biosynthesis